MVGESVDDVVGVIYLRDVPALPVEARADRHAHDAAREPVFITDSLPLPDALEQLREAGEEFACPEGTTTPSAGRP